MEFTMEPYKGQFSTEERKHMIAQTMGQLRKGMGMSQKEAAAQIGVSQAAYSAYERGVNEPPMEMMVRLSYLFGCPIDLLAQRDRLARTAEDAREELVDVKRQIAELKAQAGDNQTAMELVKELARLADQMERITDMAGAEYAPR